MYHNIPAQVTILPIYLGYAKVGLLNQPIVRMEWRLPPRGSRRKAPAIRFSRSRRLCYCPPDEHIQGTHST